MGIRNDANELRGIWRSVQLVLQQIRIIQQSKFRIRLRSRNLSPPAPCHYGFPSCAPTVIRDPYKPGVVHQAIELTKLHEKKFPQLRSLRPEPSGGRVHQLSGSLHSGNCVVSGSYLVAALLGG